MLSRATKPKTPPEDDDATKRRSTTDAQLRERLIRAKQERHAQREPQEMHDADITQQDLATSDIETAPSVDALDFAAADGGMTMPVGRAAVTARKIGTDRAIAALFAKEQTPEQPAELRESPSTKGKLHEGTSSPDAQPSRDRHDTPRVQHAMRPVRPEAPPHVERPVIDEPTYTGPMPGRAPHMTPTGSDLSKFLQPGNYQVRVDQFVYDPVSETELVRLLNAGVFFAIDELRPQDGEWVPISSPELFADLKRRLAHRAHHMLAKVVAPRPASDYPRPAPAEIDDPHATAIEAPEVAAALRASAEPEPTDDPPVLSKPRGRFVVPALALTAVAVLAIAIVVNVGDQAGAMIATEPPPVDEEDVEFTTIFDDEDDGAYDPIPTFQSATAAVNSAYAVANSIDGMLVVANDENDEVAATTLAFEKWKRRPNTVEPVALAKKLMARESWPAARQVANWARVSVEDTPELQEIVTRSLREQFEDESAIEINEVGFAAVSRVHPGQRPTLVLIDHVGDEWSLWPNLGRDEWKNDIAAYRLCQILVCHYRTEVTREAWITRETLTSMIASSPLTVRETTESMMADFKWSSDGRLRGSLRRVPTGGAPWPLEATQVWRPWLTAGAGVANLDETVEQAQQQVSFFGAERVYPEITGVRARQIARQVSSMLLVDYLTNNWDRFGASKETWGTRTYIDDGLIYSVSDLAAFSDANGARVEGRLSWSKRFSRATVESLRNLDEELVKQYLFPEPTKQDIAKIERLFTQRGRALIRIDRLVKQYGAEDVYAVDARFKEINR